MTAEILLDTENVFYRFSERRRPQGEARTIQDELFGPPREGERELSLARVLLSVLDLTIQWFARESGKNVQRVDSWGKSGDPGVRTFLTALAGNEDTFARADPESFETVIAHSHAYFRHGDVDVFHRAVGYQQHAAERALVREFRQRLGTVQGAGAYLIGSADHDAIYPVDRAAVSRPDLQLRVLLPPKSSVWRRAHRLGSYAHLDGTAFVTIGEIVAASTGGERVRLRARRREAGRVSAVQGNARRAVREVHSEGLSMPAEARLATLVGIHESALSDAAVGTEGWIAGVHDPWLLRAVDSWLPEVARPAVLGALATVGIDGADAAALVRRCGILQLLAEEHTMPPDALRRYLVVLCEGGLAPFRAVLAALDAVAPREAPNVGRSG